MSPPKRAAESTEALRESLIDHARRLITRDGSAALTMRRLAAEAGCAVGLPYKVFADRHDLVARICHAEFARLDAGSRELVERAGHGSVGANLTWFAGLLLDSPAVVLVKEIIADEALAHAVSAPLEHSGSGPAGFESAFAGYLAAEKLVGRVRPTIDERAYGFVLAGAVHNLVVSGDAWPRVDRVQLRQHLEAIAASIAPEPHPPTESRPA